MAVKKAFKCRLSALGNDLGEFDAFTGGAADHTETKYTPFDGVQRTYLSFPELGNITLSRSYEEARDGDFMTHAPAYYAAPCTVVVLDRDASGNYQQNRAPYNGAIKAITPPEGDSNASDIQMLTIEVSVGTVGT
jgi:hypothetical protein